MQQMVLSVSQVKTDGICSLVLEEVAVELLWDELETVELVRLDEDEDVKVWELVGAWDWEVDTELKEEVGVDATEEVEGVDVEVLRERPAYAPTKIIMITTTTIAIFAEFEIACFKLIYNCPHRTSRFSFSQTRNIYVIWTNACESKFPRINVDFSSHEDFWANVEIAFTTLSIASSFLSVLSEILMWSSALSEIPGSHATWHSFRRYWQNSIELIPNEEILGKRRLVPSGSTSDTPFNEENFSIA
jgi:hypothetical protein